MCGVCGGYAERAGEAGGRGEALDAARARLRALVAEGGVAAEGERHPSKGREGVGRRRDGEAGAVEGGIEECTE